MIRRRGHLIGGGAFQAGGQLHRCLAVLDLDRPEPAARRIALDFLAHGFSPRPGEPHRAAIFEKKGPGAALVDLREAAVERPLTTASERQFYGHGAWSADGSLLYAVESRLDRDFAGHLVIRDGRDLRELGELPTHGTAPHDCQLLDGGKVMAVTNGGGPHGSEDLASVTWVELSSGKLLDRAPLSDPRFNAGHLAAEGDTLAVVSAPREGLPASLPQLGAVSLRRGRGPLVTMTSPPAVVARMKGETLSVLVDDAMGLALATHPLGDLVTVWNTEKQRLIESIEVPNPRGVALALDGRSYLLSHLSSGVPRVTELDRDTRKPTGLRVSPSFLSGSHVFTHDLSPRAP